MSDRAPVPVRVEIRGGIAWVLIDNPPVNATSQAVRAGVLDGVRMADANVDVDAANVAKANAQQRIS